MSKRTTISAALPQMKPGQLRTFHAALARWYQTHGRHDLPWRTTDDPYHIWLSEVMLQQTQVATVRDRFYAPFLAKFPSVEALAAAPEAAVMKAWEGLGYYSRARNLHKAAKQIVSSEWWVVSCKESLPLTTHHSLLTSLPGIGRNTASAILAFAYHQPVAILEANVKRVVARIFALETPTDEQLWAGAAILMGIESHLSEPNARSIRAQKLERTTKYVSSEHGRDTAVGQRNGLMPPFDYNQAMMDLGSMICTPKTPSCDACPAASLCAGKSSPLRYPARKQKKVAPTRRVVITVREDVRGCLFLEPRNAKLLGGLWGFPQMLQEGEASRPSEPSAREAARHGEVSKPSRAQLKKLGTVTHIYSHFKLIGEVVHEKQTGISNSPDWHTREEIAALPLSTLDHKVLALVEKHHTAQNKPRKKAPACNKN
jgi:A/G-specific adenine glycosylase